MKPQKQKIQKIKKVVGCRRGVSAGAYKSKPPKPFRLIEPLHERAIVYPWLYVLEPWDELRHSLRSLEQHFSDKDCPIYIIGDRPPPWLVPGGRISHIHIPEYAKSREAGLWEAWQIGVQIAKEVCWMNDDIYFLRETGWDDLRTALTEGELDALESTHRESSNIWRKTLGDAVAELRMRGFKPIWNYATHTPFLFEREKSIEIMRSYYIGYKGGWVTTYHNHFHTPHQPAHLQKARRLPCSPELRYLNNTGRGPDKPTQEELLRLFPTPAPWEKP